MLRDSAAQGLALLDPVRETARVRNMDCREVSMPGQALLALTLLNFLTLDLSTTVIVNVQPTRRLTCLPDQKAAMILAV